MTSNSRIFLALLFGLASILMPFAAHAQVGAGGNTCVYVFGTINGRTVTTPSIMVVVPSVPFPGPVRVHVDPLNFTILGYTLTTPGVDQTVYVPLFLPDFDPTVPTYSATIDGLNVNQKRCLNFGLSTPAVEIDVPATALADPSAVVATPEITINEFGVRKTVSGQTITINCQTIVVPGTTETVPSLTADTPDQTIAVNRNGIVNLAGLIRSQPDGVHQVDPPPASASASVSLPGCQIQ